jgi:drug/metabolite transporter (DMT)-like permease
VEIIGILAAVASSSLDGLSVGVTRLVVGSTDPITLGAFRFGIGSLLLLPLAWRHRARWPNIPALAPIAGLGLLYFGLFPVLFNASLIYTTAARGSLALSTLPLLTMLVAAMLHVETLTRAKTAGVVVATIGVAVALFTGLDSAPSNAWRGDVLMVAAALCMALHPQRRRRRRPDGVTN